MKIKILIITVLTIFAQVCFVSRTTAQNDSQFNILNDDTADSFPPLSIIIDSAMAHNAMVKYREHDINTKSENLRSQRFYWTRNLGIQADTRYGTFNNFSTSTTEGQTPSILATNTSQINYGIGAYIKFPVFDLINRKTQVNQAREELKEAESMADAQRDEVRQMVIRMYNDLFLKKKLLNIKARNLGNSKVNMEMVEKEFRNGVVSVSEYARISEIVSRAESDFESARTDYITAYMVLEDMVGFKLIKSEPERNHEGN